MDELIHFVMERYPELWALAVRQTLERAQGQYTGIMGSLYAIGLGLILLAWAWLYPDKKSFLRDAVMTISWLLMASSLALFLMFLSALLNIAADPQNYVFELLLELLP